MFAQAVAIGIVGGVVYPWALCRKVIIVTVARLFVDVNSSIEYVILISTSTNRGGVELGM